MKMQRGISMIEVVVTIAIMGILMAAAMPSVGDWMRNSKVRNTAESIQNGLQLARMEAVRRNRPVSFNLVSSLASSCTLSSTSGNWVVSGDANPAGHCDAVPSPTAPQMVAKGSVTDGGGATVSAKDAANAAIAPATVSFNGFGMLSSASLVRAVDVASSDGMYKLRVEITAGGAARLCDPKVDTAGDSRACIP